MTGKKKVSAPRSPLKILAIFTLAFALQGMNLAVFQGGRDTHETEQSSPQSLRMGAPIMASETFSVTTTEDSGFGSLRQAILDANNNPGPDEIRFLFAQPVTITLSSSLVITDALSISGDVGTITDTHPGGVALDGYNVSGNMIVVSDAPGTRLQRLRLINAFGGYGMQIMGTSEGTAIISNTFQTGNSGILLDGTSYITVTQNILLDLVEMAVEARNSTQLWFLGNRMRAGDAGIALLDGVSEVSVISNTVSGSFAGGTIGIRAAGVPAPTGIVIRGNWFTDTLPISFDPATNNGFPAPNIVDAYIPITGTKTLAFSALSPADPFSYTYPLSMDLYRVRNGNYTPLAKSVLYETGYFPDAFSYTVQGVDLLVTDQLALIATTANPNTSEFSQPVGFGPLPVELSSFEAIVDGPEILLTWTTASETDNAGFSVEHRAESLPGSPDSPWSELDFVQGQGSTTKSHAYSYRVEGLSVGSHHFRLKQIDHDGAFEYSKIVEASVDVPGRFVLEPAYPNPFNPSTTIRFAVATRQSVVLTLHDATGREVRELYRGNPNADELQAVDIDGSGLASGTYHVRLVGLTFTSSEKITLVK